MDHRLQSEAQELAKSCPNCKAELFPMLFGVARFGCKRCGLLVAISHIEINKAIIEINKDMAP